MQSRTTVAVREEQLPYVEQFAMRPRSGHAWLDNLRESAIQRFAALGFPTTHDEDWKYTNLAPLTKIQFELAKPGGLGGRRRLGACPTSVRLVFVDGYYAPELSAPGALGNGVVVSPLSAALERTPEKIERHLARYARFDDNALVALNTAFLSDGLYLEIPNGVVVEGPIELVFFSTGDAATVSYARNLIVAGRDTQASIVEVYAGAGSSPYFTNAVTEVVAGEGAVLEHCRLQQESDRAFHFGAVQVQQGRSSNFVSHNITFGAALARNELNAVLAGEGAECTLNGLYAVTGAQHVDNYTTMDHAMPRCTSHEMYKGILDGASQGVFHGRIIVRKDAQKTDAIQRNKNLLLSQKATINTKPQLEIYADDVKCTHGATVGQVDEDAVFYLRSRGIAREEARSLLTYAFASEMLERIKVEPLRAQLANALVEHLAESRTADGGV